LPARVAHAVERRLALSLLAYPVVLPLEVGVMIGVIVGGLGVLAILAVLIGLVLTREGRQSAWVRIAVARRTHAEQVRAVEERQAALNVLEEELDARERRLDFREYRLFEREAALELLERSGHVDGS
jgi:biopolymer transport protein ExbB/TolQ